MERLTTKLQSNGRTPFEDNTSQIDEGNMANWYLRTFTVDKGIIKYINLSGRKVEKVPPLQAKSYQINEV